MNAAMQMPMMNPMMGQMPMMGMGMPMMNGMNPMMGGMMNQMPMMMPMPMMMRPMMMARMTCEMGKDGLMMKCLPMEGMTMDMMRECCDAMNSMMAMGMPMMMMMNGMPMMMASK